MPAPDFLVLLFGKCPKMGGKLKPEDKECVEFADWLRKETLKEALPFVWCHVPNEFSGHKSHIYGALKTAMGRVKGAADYWFLGKNSFVIEMKQTGKKQSDFQIAFQFWCESVGIPYYLCFTAEEAKGLVKKESLNSSYMPRNLLELLPKE